MPDEQSSDAGASDAVNVVVEEPPASDADPLIGRIINDRYKVTEFIARGGMGRVYKAEQAPLDRVCALKILDPSYAGEHDVEFHKRFFLEASTSSKLRHPNTVTVFDYGRTPDNVYFMAMEFLEGRTLLRALRQEGPFTEERATRIACQICRSLREAHSHGLIHRDLKPANVFLIQQGDEEDFVKVLDFGLVKQVAGPRTEELTQSGLFMGSPKYISPEQIRADHVDARTDIYALGIILYEMLTGKVPFDRASTVHTLVAHCDEPVPPMREVLPTLQCSEELERVVMKCLEKRPEDRFASMDEVLAALKRARSSSTTTGAFHTEFDSSPRPLPLSDHGTDSALVVGTDNDVAPSKTKWGHIGVGVAVTLAAVIGIGMALRNPSAPADLTAPAASASAPAPTTPPPQASPSAPPSAQASEPAATSSASSATTSSAAAAAAPSASEQVEPPKRPTYETPSTGNKKWQPTPANPKPTEPAGAPGPAPSAPAPSAPAPNAPEPKKVWDTDSPLPPE